MLERIPLSYFLPPNCLEHFQTFAIHSSILFHSYSVFLFKMAPNMIVTQQGLHSFGGRGNFNWPDCCISPVDTIFPSCFSNQFLRCLGCSSNRREPFSASRYTQTSFDAIKPRPATSLPQPHQQQITMNVADYQQPCRPTLLDPSNPAIQKRGILPRQTNKQRSSRFLLFTKATKS